MPNIPYMQNTTEQNAKHTVCNALWYRMPNIPYETRYGTDYQAYLPLHFGVKCKA